MSVLRLSLPGVIAVGQGVIEYETINQNVGVRAEFAGFYGQRSECRLCGVLCIGRTQHRMVYERISIRKIGIVGGKYGKPQMYNEAGKLTKSGKAEVLRVAKDLNLSPTKATWDDALEAIGKSKKDRIELPKIPKVKNLSLYLDKFKEPLTDSFKESIKKIDVPEYFKKHTLKDILPDWLK